MLWIVGFIFGKIGEVKQGAGRQKVRTGAKRGERKRERERNEKTSVKGKGSC